MAKAKTNTIKIKLVKSLIGSSEAQRKVVKALGLTKLNKTVTKESNEMINGMIKKVEHLVKVEEI